MLSFAHHLRRQFPYRGTIKPGYTGDLRSLTVAGKQLPADVKTFSRQSSLQNFKLVIASAAKQSFNLLRNHLEIASSLRFSQ